MKRFYLKSMGCKANQFEGQIVAQRLVEGGFEEVYAVSDADYYILNSCSVTQKSDKEAMYLLRRAHSSGLKTVITGCIAQIEKEALSKLPYIDFVYGNEDKFQIVKLLNENEQYSVKNLTDEDEFCKVSLKNTSKTRISIKIQDGCDNRCSYCIIPFGRGKSRYADSEYIVNEINRYANLGYKEVVFTGIHIGLWGNGRLVDLLKEVERKTLIPRCRLSSLNPNEITPELLNFLETSEKFCPHFHLSLQSACNKTLKRMRRYYTVEFYLDKIEDIVSRFDKPFLGSDIIAGFAGETEEDFLETVENLRKSKLCKIHTFPYSIRKGTEAEKMEGHLPEKVKEERAAVIREISAAKYKEFLKANVGREEEVLIEKKVDKASMYKGVTRNYLKVLMIDGEFNTLKKVRLTGTDENIMFAEPAAKI